MDERPSSTGLAVAVACLLFAICLGICVAGYFALGTRVELGLKLEFSEDLDPRWVPDPDHRVVGRGFEQEWLLKLYEPMAAMETAVTGVEVQVRMMGYDFSFTVDDSE